MAAASAVVNASRLPPGMGMSMSHMAGQAWMGAIGKQLELARPALYWPGLQGLVANPNLWRDRGNNHSGEFRLREKELLGGFPHSLHGERDNVSQPIKRFPIDCL
jgi:hypothetical protein